MISLLLCVILLLIYIPSFIAETKFLNAVGYSASITTIPGSSKADLQTALQNCAAIPNCSGLYKQPGNSTYAAIEVLRNISEDDITPCDTLYFKDRRNDTIDTGSASTIDQLLYFNFYFDGRQCHSKATFQDPYCIYSTPSTFCTRFAPFFNATVINASTCRVLARDYVEWP